MCGIELTTSILKMFIAPVLVEVADLGEGPGGAPTPPPLFWVKKEEMTERRKAGWTGKLKPGPLLSSKVWIRN